jgi:oligopeptide/dipeptide ABC transporter ATP-binding protein
MPETEYLLEVRNLKMHFPVRGGIFRRQIGSVFAVDGVSFQIRAGETVGLVGESGCGKTTVGRTILRLYKPTDGEVLFEGRNLSRLRGEQLRALRRDMQIIFQDPQESLNSRHTVGAIVEEPFVIHGIGTSLERGKAVDQIMERVGLPIEAKGRFPHEFSGGQRQRIGIARALALRPKLVVCDEPVSALDVSIRSQILNLLLKLQQELGLTYLFIAHDMAAVQHISDRIAVMYLGKIVEYADADTLFSEPAHPYTHALISAIPTPVPGLKKQRVVLSGDVPSPLKPPSGCVFHTRCPYAVEKCRCNVPDLVRAPRSARADHLQACLRAGEISL